MRVTLSFMFKGGIKVYLEENLSSSQLLRISDDFEGDFGVYSRICRMASRMEN